MKKAVVFIACLIVIICNFQQTVLAQRKVAAKNISKEDAEEISAINAQYKVAIGDIAVVEEAIEVVIKNPQGIGNADGKEFDFGSKAKIKPGGQVIAFGYSGDLIFVGYKFYGKISGSDCPSNAVFFLTVDQFLNMERGDHRNMAATKKENVDYFKEIIAEIKDLEKHPRPDQILSRNKQK